jgi:uncharacterized protein
MERVFKCLDFIYIMKQGLWFLWLSLIIIVMFVLQLIIPGFTEFFVLNEKALSGEYWRFISSIFLHGGITHLLFNLFALLFFGIILEKTIKSRRFLIVFFISGILANLISVNFYDSSLGASGAIMGIIGAVSILRPMMMVWAFGMIMPMFLASALWVIGDVLGTIGFFTGNPIDNTGNIAHLSGIFIGLIIGILMRNMKRKRVNEGSRNSRVVLPNYYVNLWEDRYVRPRN